MKQTNKFNLPDAIARAVANDPYTNGGADYSVSSLLKPARIVALEKKHWDDLEEDVSDRIWSMFGQAMHVIAERANEKGIAERRLFIEVDGKKISGGMDLYHGDGILTDYKTTSVYKVKDGVPDEYVKQLNCYAEILRQNGHVVKKLEIIAILRDWSKLGALRESDYPQSQVLRLEVPVWESTRALGFIKTRVALHEAAKASLPECAPEDRWARPDSWAVKKTPDAARATRVFDNEQEATKMAIQNKMHLEYRPGESPRCMAYCLVASRCDQFKAMKGIK
jgi:hypothetical protein